MLVSIIIPSFNVQDYINECIQSAFSQTYPNIEVICIDNNSTDDTWHKLEKLKHKYPDLIIDKELKPGAPAARNKGLRLSKGEWLQFLDADDLLLPGKIEHQMAILNKTEDQDIPFIVATCLKRDLKGNDKKTVINKNHPFSSLFAAQLGNTCSNLWNRQYIEKINGWDESLNSSQEADLMFRLLKVKDEVIYDDNPLTIVRERTKGQISQSNHSEKWQRFFNMRIEIAEWIKQYNPELYLSQETVYKNLLFGILKIMAIENIQKANQLYKQHLKGHIQPSVMQGHSTNNYLIIYRLLGFRNAELLRRWLGK